MTSGSKRIRNSFFCFLCLTIFTSLQSDAFAQRNRNSKKVEIPAPERVLMTSKDQVELRAQWFAGTKGKESVPVILVHDWDSDRSALSSLATFLQKKGHAVIVPDLRGHGDSLTVKGIDKELDRARFKKNEIAGVELDIDACRKFLQDKNNEGELNLDLLTVVAFGKMSIPAVNWCVTDWNWPPISGVKQGQNVKTLVLVSPYRRFKSLSMTQGLKSRLFSSSNAALPLMVVYGADHAASSKESAAILKTLKKSRKEPESFTDEEDRKQNQSLYRIYYNSNAEGETLLKENERDLSNAISLVIDKKILANEADFPWQSREIK